MQADLFDPARLARREDPQTSKDAASGARELQAHHEHLIVNALHYMGERGGTKDEIAEVCGIDSVAVARRMAKLRDEGRVAEEGTRTLASGRQGTVWRMKKPCA